MRIVIVDDHALFRVGIRQILEREPDFEIVAEADDARSAMDAAFATNPDVILMDLSLPVARAASRRPSASSASSRRPRSSSCPPKRTRTRCSTPSRRAPRRSSSRTSPPKTS